MASKKSAAAFKATGNIVPNRVVSLSTLVEYGYDYQEEFEAAGWSDIFRSI
ncbi:hypothetical protein SESBI_05088 [Sesbania bispinosa]|nr:hypothetical protein SESBI_05088 [Sesbania bispinosa]